MIKKLFIPVLLGTKREGNESSKVAQFLLKKMAKHPGISTQLFCSQEMNFHGDEGPDLKKKNPDYQEAMIKADGLVIIVPEYNHSFPGSLKMTMDMLSKEYMHKAVGFCGVSSGSFGGTRGIESLLSTARAIGLVATFIDLNFPMVEKLFDERGKILSDKYDKRVAGFLDELVWLSRTMKWGRENLPSKYH